MCRLKKVTILLSYLYDYYITGIHVKSVFEGREVVPPIHKVVIPIKYTTVSSTDNIAELKLNMKVKVGVAKQHQEMKVMSKLLVALLLVFTNYLVL